MPQKDSVTILKNALLQPFTNPVYRKKDAILLLLLLIGIVLSLPATINHVPPPIHQLPQPVQPEKTSVFDPFPFPDELKPQVEFWKKIFTEYTTKHVVIHDNWYVNVIYDVIDIGSSEFANEKEGWKAVKKAQKKYTRLLGNLSKKWGKLQKMTKEERQVYALFRNIPESSRFKKKNAKKRVRAQVGQADRFKEGIIRAGCYLDTMKQIVAEYDVPEKLVYLPLIESAFNPSAESYVGASGIWQFMRGTGKQYNLKINYLVDERRDPLKATHAAAQLLAHNYEAIQSWPLAITAYNHGLGGVKKAVKQTGSDNIADIIEQYNGPRFGFASRNFYVEFLAALDICLRHTEYFGEIEMQKPLELTQVELPDYVSVKTLEKYTQLTASDIKELNPALQSSIFKSGNYLPKDYQLNILANQKEVFESDYASIPNSLKYKHLAVKAKHRVRRGETLSTIARKYRTSVKALARLNNIKNPRRLRAGQILKIPGGFVSVAQKPKTESKKQTSSAHRVRKGESLSTIARKYNTTITAIASLNNIKNPRKIKIGQLLKIPEGTVLLAQKNETQTKHRVKKGQTLIAIAKRYNTSAKAIAQLNNIKNPRKLRAGQLLKIPKG